MPSPGVPPMVPKPLSSVGGGGGGGVDAMALMMVLLCKLVTAEFKRFVREFRTKQKKDYRFLRSTIETLEGSSQLL